MKPNILFLMTDQMQGRVLEADNPCLTPNFDRLASEGVRFCRAYTPNAVCSPARASLMTGLLPHSHGVLEVTHCVDDDQCNLRTQFPHWAQRLQAAGYRTGYHGKWHVERSDDLARFGWQVDAGSGSERFRDARKRFGHSGPPAFTMQRNNRLPEGYNETLLYGVTDLEPGKRGMGVTTAIAADFLQDALAKPEPWCCFVSVTEPHDPFVTGAEAYSRYDVDALPLQPNVHNDLAGQPNIYKKAGRTWSDMTDREKREAVACYYASITEIDAQFGKLIDMVDAAGARENTIVILTSDHGELLGSHGLYCKNFTGFEEVYQIPMVMSGPGIERGVVSQARVGLHDLAPTLMDLTGLETLGAPDSRSFVPALADGSGSAGDYTRGYAEYHGGRYRVTQRVIWDGDWKLVWNGFDFDELYNLADDPYEMANRIDDPAAQDRVRALMAYAWRVVRDTGDGALWRSHYPVLRCAPFGPNVAEG